VGFLLQFWNLPWWHCSAGACVDTNTDDIGYMEKLFTLIPQKFSVDQKKVRTSPSRSIQSLMHHNAMIWRAGVFTKTEEGL
jgi:hypothetical protein